jgi:hypothetical protein
VDDPDAPPFAAALEQARVDPELSRWLDRETAFDAAIGAKLREAPTPLGLRTRILAGRPAEATRSGWRRPAVVFAPLLFLAVVAATFVALEWRPSSGDFASYRGEMAALVSGDYKMDIEAPDLARLREFFAGRRWPSAYTVPPALEHYPLEGGMAVRWRGHEVSVICFGVENDESKDLFLFVIDRQALRGAPSTAGLEFERVAKLTTAAWTSGRHLYLLSGRADEPTLRKYL